MKRRTKIVRATSQFIINLLNMNEIMNDLKSDYFNIVMVKFSVLPDGCIFDHAYWDHNNNCWNLIVTHESFDEIQDGDPVPIIEGVYNPTISLVRSHEWIKANRPSEPEKECILDTTGRFDSIYDTISRMKYSDDPYVSDYTQVRVTIEILPKDHI
jgi:hypothetical protein